DHGLFGESHAQSKNDPADDLGSCQQRIERAADVESRNDSLYSNEARGAIHLHLDELRTKGLRCGSRPRGGRGLTLCREAGGASRSDECKLLAMASIGGSFPFEPHCCAICSEECRGTIGDDVIEDLIA